MDRKSLKLSKSRLTLGHFSKKIEISQTFIRSNQICKGNLSVNLELTMLVLSQISFWTVQRSRLFILEMNQKSQKAGFNMISTEWEVQIDMDLYHKNIVPHQETIKKILRQRTWKISQLQEIRSPQQKETNFSSILAKRNFQQEILNKGDKKLIIIRTHLSVFYVHCKTEIPRSSPTNFNLSKKTIALKTTFGTKYNNNSRFSNNLTQLRLTSVILWTIQISLRCRISITEAWNLLSYQLLLAFLLP